ncbi:MAG: heme-binding protein [Alphaproteobacteria bacterium]|nr:heme-binding protein [Alphaproteobacteria bacterium]
MPSASTSATRIAANLTLGAAVAIAVAGAAQAANCPVTHDQLTQALKASVKPSGGPSNGGLDNNEWAAVVTRDGLICSVTFSGQHAGDQWPGSRAIAAEKAATANGFSLDQFALSTANLYAGAQPGGPLYSIIGTNPPNTAALYGGDPGNFGSSSDPLDGKALGGGVVFGGGLGLYDGKAIIGGIGISGDTSCADHNVAWRVRHALGLDKMPGGGPNTDQIIYDIGPNGKSSSGFGHPKCPGTEDEVAKQIGAGK